MASLFCRSACARCDTCGQWTFGEVLAHYHSRHEDTRIALCHWICDECDDGFWRVMVSGNTDCRSVMNLNALQIRLSNLAE